MMMAHSYAHMFLVEGGAFRRMVTPLNLSIQNITRSKLTRTIIPHKFNKAETDSYSFLDGVIFVVVSYNLWISKNTQDIFPMTEHYTRYNVREHDHIRMPITTSTDGEIIAVTVGNAINQFILVSELVGITSDGGTNLATCKAI